MRKNLEKKKERKNEIERERRRNEMVKERMNKRKRERGGKKENMGNFSSPTNLQLENEKYLFILMSLKWGSKPNYCLLKPT